MWKACVCNVSPPTLRECALFRKRVLWIMCYGLGYSVWFLDMAWVKRKHQLVLTWGQYLCVWQDLCTLRGKSTKDTVNSIAITAHTHNNTYLHVHTNAQTHTHNGHTALCKYRYGTFMNICTNIICCHNISKLKCRATLLWHFFLLSVLSF